MSELVNLYARRKYMRSFKRERIKPCIASTPPVHSECSVVKNIRVDSCPFVVFIGLA